MGGWVAKKNIHPFEFLEIYDNPLCIAILPIRDNLSKNDAEYIKIKNLYYKMLDVLSFSAEQLLKVVFHYSKQEYSLIKQQQNLLTKKLLYFNPKSILLFGGLDFLDVGLLNLENVFIMNTFHPEHLLINLQDKRQAHQDLLLCKKKLITLF